MSELDKETQERIEDPVSEQAEEETRLTPAEAVAQMRIKVPTRANRKLATLVDRINEDAQVKAWWHVSNVNAVKRLEINDHSWVHIQIVTNIALKLLRQLTKHHVEPAMVRDYGMSQDDGYYSHLHDVVYWTGLGVYEMPENIEYLTLRAGISVV